MNIEQLHNLYKQSFKVSTDTRKIEPKSIFFALKGENFNGNKFAGEALQQGAMYAIIDEVEFKTNDNIILVENVLETLQELATYHRNFLKIPIIALTGSNGKTTTKELINAVLGKKYRTTATIGNLNNHIGVPLTILSMTPQTEIGIVEMGANHLKEIEALSNIAQPDYGYITNFGKAHLEGFGSLEGVVKGKTELYQHLKKHHKTVFVNANDAKQVAQTVGIQQVTFGSKNSDYVIEFIGAVPFVHLKFNNTNIESKLIGDYNFNNISVAIAMGTYFKVSDAHIKEAIEYYIPSNNRSQMIEKGSNKIILDAYNANPSSMHVALENFSTLTYKNKIAILGDMFELGPEAEKEHQIIADLAIDSTIETIFLLGENFFKIQTESTKVKKFRNFDDFQNHFSTLKIGDATLLIKASRGMALERILDLL